MHDCCIYKKVIDGSVIYLLRQINDCALMCCDQKTAENIFNIIGTKMRFKDEEEKGIIPFQFLGIICDYNVVDIEQTSHYVDMSCETYINHLAKSHNWDINSQFYILQVEIRTRKLMWRLQLLLKSKCHKLILQMEIPYNPFLNTLHNCMTITR